MFCKIYLALLFRLMFIVIQSRRYAKHVCTCDRAVQAIHFELFGLEISLFMFPKLNYVHLWYNSSTSKIANKTSLEQNFAKHQDKIQHCRFASSMKSVNKCFHKFLRLMPGAFTGSFPSRFFWLVMIWTGSINWSYNNHLLMRFFGRSQLIHL